MKAKKIFIYGWILFLIFKIIATITKYPDLGHYFEMAAWLLLLLQFVYDNYLLRIENDKLKEELKGLKK